MSGNSGAGGGSGAGYGCVSMRFLKRVIPNRADDEEWLKGYKSYNVKMLRAMLAPV